MKSQEVFHSSKFYWCLQLFLIREGRNVITPVTDNARYTPPEHTSMGTALKQYVIKKGWAIHATTILLNSCLSSFYPPWNLWACLSSRLSGDELQHEFAGRPRVWSSPKTQILEQEFKLDLPLCYLEIACAGLDRHGPGASLDRALQSVKQSSHPLIASMPYVLLFAFLNWTVLARQQGQVYTYSRLPSSSSGL